MMNKAYAAVSFLAVAIAVQLTMSASSATVTVAAAHAHATRNIYIHRRLMQQTSTCGVTPDEVGAAFDAFRDGDCSAFGVDLATCCTNFVEDLQNSSPDYDPDEDVSASLLPQFARPCADRLREVGVNGVCGLVSDTHELQDYSVLQPLLDRCESLREPCVVPPPPPPCDSSVAVVNAAVEAAYTFLRGCGSGGLNRPCTDQGAFVPYDCPQSGVCADGTRCSFAPSRGEEIACCQEASKVLFSAIPCLGLCDLYCISNDAENFLTTCQDVSACAC